MSTKRSRKSSKDNIVITEPPIETCSTALGHLSDNFDVIHQRFIRVGSDSIDSLPDFIVELNKKMTM